MGHKPAKSVSRSLARSATIPVDPNMDRKVYIPLCFCLVSFAVMVYIN